MNPELDFLEKLLTAFKQAISKSDHPTLMIARAAFPEIKDIVREIEKEPNHQALIRKHLIDPIYEILMDYCEKGE